MWAFDNEHILECSVKLWRVFVFPYVSALCATCTHLHTKCYTKCYSLTCQWSAASASENTIYAFAVFMDVMDLGALCHLGPYRKECSTCIGTPSQGRGGVSNGSFAWNRTASLLRGACARHFCKTRKTINNNNRKMCFFIDPLLTVVVAGWAMTHLHEWTTSPKHLNSTLCNICCNSVSWFKHFWGKR